MEKHRNAASDTHRLAVLHSGIPFWNQAYNANIFGIEQRMNRFRNFYIRNRAVFFNDERSRHFAWNQIFRLESFWNFQIITYEFKQCSHTFRIFWHLFHHIENLIFILFLQHNRILRPYGCKAEHRENQ